MTIFTAIIKGYEQYNVQNETGNYFISMGTAVLVLIKF